MTFRQCVDHNWKCFLVLTGTKHVSCQFNTAAVMDNKITTDLLKGLLNVSFQSNAAVVVVNQIYSTFT